MNEIHALLLGIVEGFTEFLPVSSTGHLVLLTHALGLEQTEFVKSFEIVVQLGAIAAVVVLYARRFLRDVRAWTRIAVAFLPIGVVGLFFYDFIRGVLFESPALVVTNFIVVGVVLGVVDRFVRYRRPKEDVNEISLWTALWIGVFQATSVVPGVSRSGATIVGGLGLGMSRTAAAEFSFLLAAPTMLVASGYDLYKGGAAFTGSEWGLLALGSLASFLVAIVAVRWLLAFVSRYTFLPFAIYRIVMGIVYGVVFL